MQNSFSGMYNGGNTYTGAMQQGTGFNTQITQTSFYPSWFVQYTNRQPMQIDQTINSYFNNYLSMLYQAGIGQKSLGNIAATGEADILLNKIRVFAFVIMVDKTSAGAQQPTNFIIERCIEVVVLGEIVKRNGGPYNPYISSIGQTLNVDIVDRFNTYMQFEAVPDAYQRAVASTENAIRNILQQQQQHQIQQNTFGSGFNAHPSAAAAVPSANYSAYLNPQATPTFNNFNAAPPSRDTTINQIGQVANTNTKSVYEIAMENERSNTVAQQSVMPYNTETVNKTVAEPAPVTNADKGVYSAFELAAMLRNSNADIRTPDVEKAEPAPAPAVESKQTVIPNGWSNNVSDAGGLADPTPESTVPPKEGLPTIGMYNFGVGNATTMEDFKTDATVEEHVRFAPKATHSINNESDIDEDDFLSAIDYQCEAEIQSEHEEEIARGNSPEVSSSMDDLVKQGIENSVSSNLDDAELRVDFGVMNSESRKTICKRYHIRLVPAYVKGHDRIIQIMKGKVRNIVIEREEPVNYDQHETELDNGAPVFATWDAAARNIEAGKTAMANVSDRPIWSSEVLLEKLEERLGDSEDTTETETKIAEVIAESSIIKIDGVLQSATSTVGDYQGEVLEELVHRGLGENAGNILDNAIVEYTRFETTRFSICDENKTLIEAISEATSLPELISALNKFRKESTLPVREIARLHHAFVKFLNQYLKMEFSNGWETTDPIEDLDELIRELLKEYLNELSSIETMNKLSNIYLKAAKKAYELINPDVSETETETLVVGNGHHVVLLPIYYSQYPIAAADDVGVIRKEDHPELYELLRTADIGKYDVKIVTLDNYALTFVRSPGVDDLLFLVNVSN